MTDDINVLSQTQKFTFIDFTGRNSNKRRN